MNRYAWLWFDADNTLFDFDLAASTSFSYAMSGLGLSQDAEWYEVFLRVNRQCWDKLEKGLITPGELKKARFALLFDELGLEADPVQANQLYMDSLSNCTIPLDGAIELLQTLSRQSYRMAIVTNGLREVQIPRFNRSDLGGFFETFILSEDAGVAKPDVGFFQYAFDRMPEARPEQVLIIGDNPHTDILGGQNAGIDTCWLNMTRETNPLPGDPTYQISHLRELIEILEQNSLT